MRQATHPEFQKDYETGYDAMQYTIATLGWEAARDQYNQTYPLGQMFDSMANYYYAVGGIDALLDAKK